MHKHDSGKRRKDSKTILFCLQIQRIIQLEVQMASLWLKNEVSNNNPSIYYSEQTHNHTHTHTSHR